MFSMLSARAAFAPLRLGLRGFKQAANTIRVGEVIDIEGKMCTIIGTSRIERGRGKSYVQFEFRELKSGNKGSERFRVADMVERVQMDTKTLQYLYTQGDKVFLMNNETFETLEVPKETILGPPYLFKFLTEGTSVSAQLLGEQVLSIELPKFVTATVAEADLKGQQASPTFKDAVLENGVKIQVPPYVVKGDRVVVRTEDLSFSSREK